MPDEDENRLKAARQRESFEEWLRQNRAETARRDLSDAAPQTDRGTSSPTQLEALDRAAHTPAFHQREPLFSVEEEKRLAERERDYAELYPTADAWVRGFPELPRPDDPALRAQYDDFAQLQKEAKDVTPEQKANVDKALALTSISKEISAGGDVSGKPAPNEPTPVDKSRDVGQDLQKAGVTMEKE